MKIHILILEPDKLVGNLFVKLIEEEFSRVEVVGLARDVNEALKFIATNNIDVMIIDVTDSKVNGFSLFEHVNQDKYKVIFTGNNYDKLEEAQYFYPFGYLCKPINKTEFCIYLNRAIKDIITADYDDSIIHISKASEIISVRKSDIIRCEAESNYTKIILANNNQPLIVSRTLKYVHSTFLGNDEFVRIHKSHLINKRHIISRKIKAGKIQLKNGQILPVSRTFKNYIEKILFDIR